MPATNYGLRAAMRVFSEIILYLPLLLVELLKALLLTGRYLFARKLAFPYRPEAGRK